MGEHHPRCAQRVRPQTEDRPPVHPAGKCSDLDRDPGFLLDKCQEAFARAMDYVPDVLPGEEEKLVAIFRERPFIPPGEIIDRLGGYTIIFTDKVPAAYKTNVTIDMSGRAHPSFNKISTS
ncbi:MAG: hypothetical protein IPJ06_12300 [Saprospiraceae bacterium]|nr:hypothetical protein [Saprospiraceae bacterium]